VGNDNILVTANLLEDGGFELCKVGFSVLGTDVSWNGSFKISHAFSNLVGGLIGLPHTVDSQFLICSTLSKFALLSAKKTFR
jgi:hypothetical protein